MELEAARSERCTTDSGLSLLTSVTTSITTSLKIRTPSTTKRKAVEIGRLQRIRRQTYKSRAEARQDVFDYIEMFYNPKRKHVRNGMLSPVEFERQQKMSTEGV